MLSTTIQSQSASQAREEFEKKEGKEVKKFYENRENVMNSIQSACIGKFLLSLAESYLPQARDQKEDNESEKSLDTKVEKYIQEFCSFLKDTCSLTKGHKDLHGVIDYIHQDIATAEINQFDVFSIYDEKKQAKVNYTFRLKQVFALVTAAILDPSKYTVTRKDEEKYKSRDLALAKYKEDRVLTLFNIIRDLSLKRVCHPDFEPIWR